MAVTQFACPDCKAVLKPAKPVPDGRKVKCPKCAKIFIPSALKTAPSKPAAGLKPDSGPDFELVEDDGPDFELVEDEGPDFEVVEKEKPKPSRRQPDQDEEARTSKPKPTRKTPAHADKTRPRDDEDEEDDDRPAKRRKARDEDDEDDERPAKRHKARDEDDEDDDRPAKRHKKRDEDDEEENDRPAKRHKKRDDYEDEEEEDDDYDDEGEDDRPAKRSKRSKKKKPGSKLLMVLGIVGGVVLLLGLGGGALGYWLWNKPVIPSSEWTEVGLPGKFSVLIPGTPQLKTEKGKDGVTSYDYTVKRDKEEMEFVVGYMEDTGATAAFIYALFTEWKVDGKPDEGKKVKDKDIVVDGHAGKEIHIEGTKEGNLAARLFLIKEPTMTRLFAVIVKGKGVKLGRRDSAKFLNSFRFK
jgi:hypothetical protein